jgi:hypothetical protein
MEAAVEVRNREPSFDRALSPAHDALANSPAASQGRTGRVQEEKPEVTVLAA